MPVRDAICSTLAKVRGLQRFLCRHRSTTCSFRAAGSIRTSPAACRGPAPGDEQAYLAALLHVATPGAVRPHPEHLRAASDRLDNNAIRDGAPARKAADEVARYCELRPLTGTSARAVCNYPRLDRFHFSGKKTHTYLHDQRTRRAWKIRQTSIPRRLASTLVMGPQSSWCLGSFATKTRCGSPVARNGHSRTDGPG